MLSSAGFFLTLAYRGLVVMGFACRLVPPGLVGDEMPQSWGYESELGVELAQRQWVRPDVGGRRVVSDDHVEVEGAGRVSCDVLCGRGGGDGERVWVDPEDLMLLLGHVLVEGRKPHLLGAAILGLLQARVDVS